MPAPMKPVLSLVRCPTCASNLTAAGAAETEGAESAGLRCENGHEFDLVAGRAPDLAGEVVQEDSLGQRAMRFAPLVAIYESLWRPMFTAAAGGSDPSRETAELLDWLDVGADAVLLDVACGPGNTTRRLAVGVPEGSVIGVDLSVPMLQEAVARTPDTATIGFARVDAHRLPLDDASVDGVHCAAALYLLADPGAVVAEMARVLRPGCHLVGMTLVAPFRPIGPLGRFNRRVTSTLSGVRYLGSGEVERLCTSAGLGDFRTERRGAALLFSATRPA